MVVAVFTRTFSMSKEVLSQLRIRHFKILQSIYFAYEVGIISSYLTTFALAVIFIITIIKQIN